MAHRPAIRVAGIGAGYFSRFHLEGWRDVCCSGDAEVVAWCDTDDDKVRSLAAMFGVPRTFADAAAKFERSGHAVHARRGVMP